MTKATFSTITAPPAQASEEELVRLAAAGSASAFASLMRRHNQRLFRTARSIINNDSEAEEAVQDAYLKAWRALGEFRADSKLSTWLTRIVVNEALGRRRRSSAQLIPLEAAMIAPDDDIQAALTEQPQRGPEQQAARAQLRSLLEARIDALPELYRSVFVLRAVEELSVEETAAVLDMPEATVRTRFFRARSLLREGLASAVDHALGEAFAFDGERCDRIVSRVLERGRALGLGQSE